jgi:hypothetical protein
MVHGKTGIRGYKDRGQKGGRPIASAGHIRNGGDAL